MAAKPPIFASWPKNSNEMDVPNIMTWYLSLSWCWWPAQWPRCTWAYRRCCPSRHRFPHYCLTWWRRRKTSWCVDLRTPLARPDRRELWFWREGLSAEKWECRRGVFPTFLSSAASGGRHKGSPGKPGSCRESQTWKLNHFCHNLFQSDWLQQLVNL